MVEEMGATSDTPRLSTPAGPHPGSIDAAHGQPAIQVRGLEKAYGQVRALCGVDLDVATGSILGLLGPNGAGKTTMVRIVAALLKPDAGTARVAGLDVVSDAGQLLPANSRAARIASSDPSGRKHQR